MLANRFEPCGLQVILPDKVAEEGYHVPEWSQHPLILEHLPRLRQPPIYVSDAKPERVCHRILTRRDGYAVRKAEQWRCFYVQSNSFNRAELIPTPCTRSTAMAILYFYTCIEVDGALRYTFSEPWSTSDRLVQWRLVNMAIEQTVKTGLGTLGVNMGAKLAADQAWAHLYGNKLSYQNVHMLSDTSRHMVLCGAESSLFRMVISPFEMTITVGDCMTAPLITIASCSIHKAQMRLGALRCVVELFL